ncbi:MAG: hypothetical protein Q8R78_06455 [Candidatus Omnitrophota bacterium]|nr:hypothetical protein [Candidatus Omnitrophota bacterium]
METDDPLWNAIKAARARWSADGPERSPVRDGWGPPWSVAGDRSSLTAQAVAAAVPRVPRVPSEKQDIRQRTSDQVAADAWAEWEERAAIREYDGGMSRLQAERLAEADLGARPPRPASLGF